MNIFEKIKEAVNIADVVESFGVKLNNHDKSCCPFHSEKTPSFSVKREDNMFKCFGCGESGDSVDFVAKIKNIDKMDAAKLLAGLYHIDIDIEQPKAKNTARTSAKVDSEQVADGDKQALKTAVTEYIKSCIKDSDKTDYFARRGLSEDTVKKYFLGYDIARKSVLIPYSSKLTYYQTRSVEGKSFYKPKTEDAGAEPLFNGDILWKSKEPIFVVESPICALSIMQCGVSAIALCGVGGANKLIKEVKAKKPTATLILSLDNDEPGQKASQDLANELFELGVKFDVANISGSCKDPNELLMQEPKKLEENISKAVQMAKVKFSRLTKLFSIRELQQRTIKPIRWIVKGLLPEGLAIICAPSKYGKSWMMMQLGEAVCDGKPFLDFQTEKCECAYFSLEDSERRIQSRADITMSSELAPHGFYGMTECSSMANGLFDELAELVAIHPQIKLIIIDTFQKVRAGQTKNESTYSADYREMGEFKKFADKNSLCILLVHHLRKQLDDSDIYNRINGSMGIMGAADTIWVLSKKNRKDDNVTLMTTGRDIEDKELIVNLDKTTFHWEIIGSADDEAYRKAKAEYESNPVIKTIKALVEKMPSGWSGTSSEIKVKIYETTGALFSGSAESIGKTISKYLDRLMADGIEHKDARGKRHMFCKKQRTMFDYSGSDDD